MENKKGSGIFLSVIGVATLIVAIIGATFAYFSATAAGENVVNVGSTTLSLGFSDKTGRLKTNMIPASDTIAEYAAFDEQWRVKGTEIAGDANLDGKTDEGEVIVSPGECIDQNGNEICSVYEFYVGNPSTSSAMDVEGEVFIVKNEFANLYYAIYDENGKQVIGATKFLTENDDPAKLTNLNQQLKANPNVANRLSGEETVPGFTLTVAYDKDKPITYNPLVDFTDEKYSGEDVAYTELNGATNVRHYTMLIWIRNLTNEDQTGVDAGKIFSAGIRFSTGGQGVSGVIAVAGDESE